MACVGRYLVVVGGLTHAACGQAARAQDCCLYDTAAGCWDLLDSCAFEPAAAGPSSEAGAAVSMAGWRSSSCGGQRSSKAGREAPAAFLGAASAAFVGSNLLLLKAVPGSGLSELWSVDLQPPEAIERQAAAKQAATAVVQRLALTCEDVTATSVR